MNLRILTYNIHKGFSTGNKRFVLHQMREQLHRANVDLVFLQEIQGEHNVRSSKVFNWPSESQFEFLAESLWPHYAYGKNAIYNAGHHGNAILSKFPFVRWQNINVSSMRRASRSLLHGVIKLGDGPQAAHVVCIHLDIVAYERERQLDLLSNYIAKHIPRHEPLIVAGDFNDWRSRAARHFANDLGLTEIFLHTHGHYAKTFPSWMPMFPLDRIYYRALEPLECVCYKHSPWHTLSDHAPLYASFNLDL
jgi:endonuclease/exonuclease/phosphatase family metal-dependent hydrolase